MVIRRLTDSYRFTGFKPQEKVSGMFGDSKARIVRLVRTGKKLSADVVGRLAEASTTARQGMYATYPLAMHESISSSKSGVLTARSVAA
jgi:hypothetical protein